MKQCKNHKSKKYKGNENTPLGKGYHACGFEEGKKMKGKDNFYYKVIKTIKGKRWKKVANYRGMQDMNDPGYAMRNIK